jgi:geranylgeranyl pyrophosphate synthase
MNAPVLLALESERLNADERQVLKAHIQHLFKEPGDAMAIQAIQELLNTCDALGETRLLAQRYIDEAKQALDFVADSLEKQALFALVDYVIQRRH